MNQDRIKVTMIANALVGGFNFAKGKDYMVDAGTYESMKQSCKLFKVPKVVASEMPDIKYVLVVVSHGLGNIINKTPMLRKIKELWPECKIDLLMRKQYVNILKGWDIIDNCIAHEPEANKFALGTIEYDLIINSLPTAININVLGLNGLTITGEPAWFRQMHEVEANIKILETYLNTPLDIPDPYIPVKRVNGFSKGKYIGICAGWDGKEYWGIKNWGYENYAILIAQLAKHKNYKGYKFLIFGIGKDAKIYTDSIYCSTMENIINCVGKYSVNETAYLISKCDFMVCNDTGLGHVASAVGTKTYSIFAGSSVIKNHPYLLSNVISKGLDCQPCQFTERWPLCKKPICMDISPDEIFETIIEQEKQAKKKTKLGIVIATYNRLEMLENLFISLYRCSNFNNIEIALIDDRTEDFRFDKTIDIWIELFKKCNVKLKIVSHRENFGKEQFSKTLQEGVTALKHCEYILFMPDDIAVNPFLFDVISESYKYFKGKMKCISYMSDTRAETINGLRSNYTALGPLDKYFDKVIWADGFLSLYKQDIFKDIQFRNTATVEGSGFWTKFNEQMNEKGYEQLRYKESLCVHLCSDSSKMNPEQRSKTPIKTINYNLVNKPKILDKEKTK